MKKLYEDDHEEEDFYNTSFLEEYVDNDEISGEEEGFMVGYLS
jgi:hypothetical protein